MSSGCSLPSNVKQHNFRAMIETGKSHEFSKGTAGSRTEWEEGGLPGMIHVYSDDWWEQPSEPYRTHGANAEEIYDSACELWQSVLDEYDISFSDIGLSERLLKLQPEQMDFCGQ